MTRKRIQNHLNSSQKGFFQTRKQETQVHSHTPSVPLDTVDGKRAPLLMRDNSAGVGLQDLSRPIHDDQLALHIRRLHSHMF
jgi:hypothetical protein